MGACKGGDGTDRKRIRFGTRASDEDETRFVRDFVHEGLHPAVFGSGELHHGKVRARVRGCPVVAGVCEARTLEGFGKGLRFPEDVDRDCLERGDGFRGRRHHRPVEPERIFLPNLFHG